VRSSSIRPEEEQLRSSLEELEEELRRGRMKGKLNELWALLGAVNASKERARNGVGEWAVVDEEGLTHLTQVSVSWTIYFIYCPLMLLDITDFSRSTSRFITPDEDPAKSIKRRWYHHGHQLNPRAIRL
jgi:hypothetical protein